MDRETQAVQRCWSRFRARGDRGASLVEYALVVSLVLVVVAGPVDWMYDKTADTFAAGFESEGFSRVEGPPTPPPPTSPTVPPTTATTVPPTTATTAPPTTATTVPPTTATTVPPTTTTVPPTTTTQPEEELPWWCELVSWC
jgi:hypothetical protein